MPEDIYRKLREHIHKLTGMGYPETETGIELEILKRIFTPEQAEIGIHLTLELESPEAIAGRLGKDPKDMADMLETMYLVGNIRKHAGDGKNPSTYAALGFAPGIIENIAKTRWESDPKLQEMLMTYLGTGYAAKSLGDTVDLLRTVPVEAVIPSDSTVAPYEQASELIKKAPRPIVILPCRCRDMHKQMGAGCDAPLDVCFVFGDHAQFYLDIGFVKEAVDEEEALKVLKVAEDAALVHTFVNYTDEELMYMCNCCKCCCWVLGTSNQLFPEGRFKGFAPSSFIANVDSETCTGCENCIDKCQTLALSMEDDIAVLKEERCIGCGLCVSECPVEAIQLVKRAEDQIPQYPETFEDLTEIAHNDRYGIE